MTGDIVDDDEMRVSKEDDHLRYLSDATVLLDDTEVLVTPVEDYEPFSRREYDAMRRRYDGGKRWDS